MPGDVISSEKKFHFKFDSLNLDEEIQANKVGVLSAKKSSLKKDDHKHHLVPDDLFGASIFFRDSDDILLIEDNKKTIANDKFTLMLWLYPFKNTAVSTIIAKKDNNNINYQLELLNDNSLQFHSSNIAKNLSYQIEDLFKNKWIHLAIVFNENNYKLYINGILKAESETVKTKLVFDKGLFSIGGQTDHSKSFNGKLAHLKLYEPDLSAETILEHMQEDLSLTATFREDHPFDFEFSNENYKDHLFYSNENEKATLTISNVSSKELKFNTDIIAGQANEENHHFELRFRPKTFLSEDSINVLLKDNPDWQSSKLLTNGLTGEQSLYFLGKGSLLPLQQKDKGQLQFQIEYNQINMGLGSRNSQVLLKYNHISYNNGSLQNGTRLKLISIRSKELETQLPLSVTIEGVSNIVTKVDAENNAANSFSVRFLNHSRHQIQFNDQSAFTPRFDNQLADNDDLKAMILTQIDQKQETILKAVEDPGGNYLWPFSPARKVLEANDSFEIKFENVISKKASGYSKFYIQYRNIPHFPDGIIESSLLKSSAVSKNVGTTELFGIGTANPEAVCHIVNKNTSEDDTKQKATLLIGPINKSHLRFGYR
jgi:hypothetical protein